MKSKFENRRFVGYAMLAATLMIAHQSIVAAGAAELPPDFQDRVRAATRQYDRGENRPALDAMYRLMSDGSSQFGAGDGRMIRLYVNLGETYSAMEQDSYAESMLKKGLAIAEKGYGKSSLQSVPALIDLAQLYVRQAKDSLALPLFKQALAIVDKPGDDSLLPYVAVIETNMGSMYYAQGNYAFGEPHFKRALDAANKALGPSHKWSTTIGGMYAACLHAGGKNKEAKAIEQAAKQKANETQSPIFAWNKKIAIADEALAANEFAEAEAALKSALAAAQELTAEPMFQAATLIRYGEFYQKQNKPLPAIEKLKAALALADTAMGPDHPLVLARAKQLADLEKSHEQYREAEPLYRRIASQAKKRSGPDSDEHAKALSELGDVYIKGANYPKAVPVYTTLLALQEKQFGADSEKLIPSLVALATAAQNNTQYFSEVNVKAEGHLKRAAEIAKKKFGNNSKEMASVLDVLSRYYQKHLEWDKAAKTCALVIAADEKNFGPESDETVKALEHYAVVLRAAGWRNQAEPVEERIAKIKGAKTEAE